MHASDLEAQTKADLKRQRDAAKSASIGDVFFFVRTLSIGRADWVRPGDTVVFLGHVPHDLVVILAGDRPILTTIGVMEVLVPEWAVQPT